MRSLVSSVFLAMSLVLAVPVVSMAQQAEIETHYLPEGRQIEHHDDLHQCYTLPEFQLVLELDQNYWHLLNQFLIQQERAEALVSSIHEFQRVVDIKNEQISVLRAERERLVEKWQEENRLRLEAESTVVDFDSWVPWVIVGVETSVLLGILAVLVL